MKWLMLFSLVVVASAPAHANPCHKTCDAEYQNCKDDADLNAQAFRTGASPAVLEAIERDVKQNKKICKKIRKLCYDDCNHPKPKSMEGPGLLDMDFD